MRTIAQLACVALLATFMSDPMAQAQCVIDWGDGFHGPGTDDRVYALTVLDDGAGPALYVGGRFRVAGARRVYSVARWDGRAWDALGAELLGDVRALSVYDDGSGPALHAGGEFSIDRHKAAERVAKWDGQRWTALGDGLPGTVHVLGVYDDGRGPALYAGGEFDERGGIRFNCIAKWDGQRWSTLGSGVYSPDFHPAVYALAVFDDGSGPALYVAGHFWKAGGIEVNSIAKWDGYRWSAVGGGVDGDIFALAVFDDGAGPALYAGGYFDYAGAGRANNIARWDGRNWSPLGSGVGRYWVRALAVFDSGSGPALYVGGKFSDAGNQPANCLAKWDGRAWSAVGSGVSPETDVVYALAGFAPGPDTETALYVGGQFYAAGGVPAFNIASCDGASFSALGDGNGLDYPISAMLAFDDGRSTELYVGGSFRSAGNLMTGGLAKWNGSHWSKLAPNLTDSSGTALAVYDDGAGRALYIAGLLQVEDGGPVWTAAKWDGARLWPLGEPMDSGALGLAVFDDGSGSALYAAGAFKTIGSVQVNYIAKWDGRNWVPLGSGLDDGVNALAVFDPLGPDAGAELYATGGFTRAGDVPARGIARWDGRRWAPLGSGLEIKGGKSARGEALTVFDDGSGSALYVGGYFEKAGGIPAIGIARWDGARWSPLGDRQTGAAVRDLVVLDDGTGPALFAGGGFMSIGGVPALGVARWDGRTWSPLGAGIEGGGTVSALAGYDDGQGPALYVGGYFSVAGGRPSMRIARWGCIPGLKLGDTNCDGKVDWLDIDPFVLALCRPAEYERLFPTCRLRTADCNADGVVNNFDIDPFVKLLSP